MSKVTGSSLSLVIGVILGLVVASWFDVADDTAYYAVVSLIAIVAMAIGAALSGKSKE